MFKSFVFLLVVTSGCTAIKPSSESNTKHSVSRCAELKKDVNYKINVVAWALDEALANANSAAREYESAMSLATRVSDGFSQMEYDASNISWYAGYARDLTRSLSSSARSTAYLKSSIQKINFPFLDGSIAQGIKACQGAEFSHDLYARRDQASVCTSIIQEAEYAGYWLNAALANSYSYSSPVSDKLDTAKWKEDASDRTYYLNQAMGSLRDTTNNNNEVVRQFENFESAITRLQSKCL